MSEDIVTRLREKYQGQLLICAEAADEIERLRTHMDALLFHNVELMAKVATLQATIDGRFESTSITQAVRGE